MKTLLKVFLLLTVLEGGIISAYSSVPSFLDRNEEEPFKAALVAFKNLRTSHPQLQTLDQNKPTCFISYAWGVKEQEKTVHTLASNLRDAGINVLLDIWHNKGGTSTIQFARKIIDKSTDFVVLCGSKKLMEKLDEQNENESVVRFEVLDMLGKRLTWAHQKRNIIPILLEGKHEEVLPDIFASIVSIGFQKKEDYCFNCFSLLMQLYKLGHGDSSSEGIIKEFNAHKTRLLNRVVINNSLDPNNNNAMEMKLTIPLVAKGYEEIYKRFLKGVLIYRPKKGSDDGMIKLPIAALSNPLEGTFDLSQCGDAGKYLSIATGYRKGKKAENKDKVEIWLAPRFLIEKELETTASHFKDIMSKWSDNAPVGIFWTWGNWDDLSWYDYLTTQNMDEVATNNLYEKWWSATNLTQYLYAHLSSNDLAPFMAKLKFHVHFLGGKSSEETPAVEAEVKIEKVDEPKTVSLKPLYRSSPNPRHQRGRKTREAQKPIVTSATPKALEIKEEEKPASKMKLTIPLAAKGYEEIYKRFLKGALIYRPKEGSDEGMIKLPIAALANPLEGTFDLSQCGNAGKYLSISTGYRKGKKAENQDKVEIWLAPRFLIEKKLTRTASHFKDIMSKWSDNAPVGIFWTWGNWDSLSWYDYLTTQNIDEVSNNNLYEKWLHSTTIEPPLFVNDYPVSQCNTYSFMLTEKISCSF